MEDPTKIEDYNYKFVTFATRRFMPSLNIWLRSTCMHGDFLGKKASIRVYLGHDIDDSMISSLKSSFMNVEFVQIPKQVPQGAFGDYWAPEHYAWKLWICQQLANESVSVPTIVLYSDAGVMTTRMPYEMIKKTVGEANSLRLGDTEAKTIGEVGLCFVEDNTQKNKFWCSENFCNIMKTTDEELEANQLVAAMITFKMNSPSVKKFFNDAYTLSLNRQVIVGPKWEGLMPTGQPFGHRHDQSILSILRLRYSAPTVMIGDIQTADSMRTARITNKAFYHHRGQFKIASEILPKITDAYVINLNRRRDRYDAFVANHGDFAKKVRRVPAIDGRQLKLTPAIARLLRPNDFFWKKSVAGCALSHLQIWNQLANESAEANAYLIMEDDVKMADNWQSQWRMAAHTIPEDWDVLYLGGVLPPNKPGLEGIKERVNDHWCRVAPNKIFNQPYPTRYFHFCNYAYVLSRRGAQKIMNIIDGRDGFYTSGDHMIVNNHQTLNIYFSDPLMATCTQENDPVYAGSAFNDFSRKDSFDSDLWNNDERWTVEEREAALANSGGKLDIAAVLQDLVKASETTDVTVKPVSEPVSEPVKTTSIASVSVNGPPIILNKQVPVTIQIKQPMSIYMINADSNAKTSIMESDWLEEIFDRQINIKKMPNTSSEFKPGEMIWIIVSKQDLHMWLKIIKIFEMEKRPFKALHISDEMCKDDISWYNSPMCKGVIRFYPRTDVTQAHVTTIPLGYANNIGTKTHTADLNREYKWSFYGTGWFDRAAKLSALSKIGPNNVKIFNKWNHPDLISRSEYFKILTKSTFVPIPMGNNADTFRFYEALEAGAIPIYVREQGDDSFWKWLQDNIPMLEIKSWSAAATAMQFLLANPEHLVKYRDGLIAKYTEMKKKYQVLINTII